MRLILSTEGGSGRFWLKVCDLCRNYVTDSIYFVYIEQIKDLGTLKGTVSKYTRLRDLDS